MGSDFIFYKAKRQLCSSEAEDFMIAPRLHAKQYQENAPILARILGTESVYKAVADYEKAKKETQEHAERYKQMTTRANGMILITGALSAFLIVIGLFGIDYWSTFYKVLVILITAASVLSGAFATMLLFQIKSGQYLEAWKRGRAKTELLRNKFFNIVTDPNNLPGKGAEPRLQALLLWYFDRYQLASHIAYFDQQKQHHRQYAEQLHVRAGFAIFLSVVAAGGAGLFAINFGPTALSLAVLGVLGAGISSFYFAGESMRQDHRNAERCDKTGQALTKLRMRLDVVERAVMQGHPEPLRIYVNAVHEQLMLEHRQWLDTSATSSEALHNLENALEAVRKHQAELREQAEKAKAEEKALQEAEAEAEAEAKIAAEAAKTDEASKTDETEKQTNKEPKEPAQQEE